MDRRSFLTGLFGISSVLGGLGTFEVRAAGQASTCRDASVENTGLTSEEVPAEFAQYRGSPHWHHRSRRYRFHRRHVRRRRVCRVHIDRWGRRVRRCHWMWV